MSQHFFTCCRTNTASNSQLIIPASTKPSFLSSSGTSIQNMIKNRKSNQLTQPAAKSSLKSIKSMRNLESAHHSRIGYTYSDVLDKSCTINQTPINANSLAISHHLAMSNQRCAPVHTNVLMVPRGIGHPINSNDISRDRLRFSYSAEKSADFNRVSLPTVAPFTYWDRNSQENCEFINRQFRPVPQFQQQVRLQTQNQHQFVQPQPQPIQQPIQLMQSSHKQILQRTSDSPKPNQRLSQSGYQKPQSSNQTQPQIQNKFPPIQTTSTPSICSPNSQLPEAPSLYNKQKLGGSKFTIKSEQEVIEIEELPENKEMRMEQSAIVVNVFNPTKSQIQSWQIINKR